MLELRELPETELAGRRDQVLERVVQRRVRLSYEEPGEARTTAQQLLSRGAGRRYFDVVDAGAPVGELVWVSRGDEAEVVELVLDEPDRAGELLAELISMARAAGARLLAVAGVPGEPARERLAHLDDFVPRATNMLLPLDGEIGDPGALTLAAMTQEEFEAWYTASAEGYVQELVSAGMSPQAAQEQSDQQLGELVPDGLDSAGQSFFTGWVDGVAVGSLWISTERPAAFVYEIEVASTQRRRGYGEAMMNAGARWCRDQGHPALALNVFAHNPGARALYDKLGYRVTADYRTADVD